MPIWVERGGWARIRSSLGYSRRKNILSIEKTNAIIEKTYVSIQFN